MQAAVVAVASNKRQVDFTIHGLNCEGYEEHVNTQPSKAAGVLSCKTSYALKTGGNFDKSKVDVKTIEAAINKTGSTVKEYNLSARRNKNGKNTNTAINNHLP